MPDALSQREEVVAPPSSRVSGSAARSSGVLGESRATYGRLTAAVGFGTQRWLHVVKRSLFWCLCCGTSARPVLRYLRDNLWKDKRAKQRSKDKWRDDDEGPGSAGGPPGIMLSGLNQRRHPCVGQGRPLSCLSDTHLDSTVSGSQEPNLSWIISEFWIWWTADSPFPTVFMMNLLINDSVSLNTLMTVGSASNIRISFTYIQYVAFMCHVMLLHVRSLKWHIHNA